MTDAILNMTHALELTAILGAASFACAIATYALLKRRRHALTIAAGALTILLIVISDICWYSALYNSGKSLFLLWIEGFPPAIIISVALFVWGAASIVLGIVNIAKGKREI